jgi:iron(II)-dependent oxidoreductase
VEVGSFAVQSSKVGNGEFLEFVEAGGYERQDFWEPEAWRYLRVESLTGPPLWEKRHGEWHYRGLFENMPLPLEWPAYVSHIEAEAYARWRGWRLLTESEWHRVTNTAERPDSKQDNFDFASWNPSPVSSGREPSQLTGNGWEWTSTVFSGFAGFVPFPHYSGYSADFFDGRHYVLKGASPVTPIGLVRPSFRNWFQDQYRYAYTGFRCAQDA